MNFTAWFKHFTNSILSLLINFTVQVSDKPKGIAVGAAKECVHTLSRVCFFFFSALKASGEQRGMTLYSGSRRTVWKKEREIERGGGKLEK